MVEDVVEVTEDVVIVNVADDAPAVTVMLGGTVALALLEDKDTIVPPTGAEPFKVTVPVDEAPPITDVGLTVTPVGTIGWIVSVAETKVPAAAAWIVATVEDGTATVDIVNVADEFPARTVTLGGATALAMLDDKVTGMPPGGAVPLSVTVAVDGAPPGSVAGDRVRVVGTSGAIPSVADTAVAPTAALITAEETEATGNVVTENVAEDFPERTVTI